MSGVSANVVAPKTPTNVHLLAVSLARTKRGGLVGGAGSQSLTRLRSSFPVFQGINRDALGRMPISLRTSVQKRPFSANFWKNSLRDRTGN
jgi:hypothetical protein